jgi:hypothetical protein
VEERKKNEGRYQCPGCKNMVTVSVAFCPHCGRQNPIAAAKTRPNQPPKGSVIPEGIQMSESNKSGCLAAFFIVIAAAFLFNMMVGSKEDDEGPLRSPTATSPQKVTVQNSNWDGSVWQVESWLKHNLKDPDSYDAIEWSPVIKSADGGFVVRVKYRAKNSFGGFVIENRIFILDSQGTVQSVADAP